MTFPTLLFIIAISLVGVAIGQTMTGTYYSDVSCTLGLPNPSFQVSNPFIIAPNACVFAGNFPSASGPNINLWGRVASCGSGRFKANYFSDSGCVTPFSGLAFREGFTDACITDNVPSPARSLKISCVSSAKQMTIAFSAVSAAFVLFFL
jgi:hypothetical protein